MRLPPAAAALLALAACSRAALAPATWYGSAQIVCQRPDCPDCRGTCGVGCRPCRATGGVPCTSCKDGTQKCAACDGDGSKHGKKCRTCDGDGRSDCWACGGDRVASCGHCDGKGQVCCLQRLDIRERGITAPDEAWPPGTFEAPK
jgi:hypothetical protein